MQLISKFNKEFNFLLCTIGIYCIDAWVISLKDKKVITITNGFQKILDKSNRKPNKIWVDKGSEFYNRSMKSFLQNNDAEIYSLHNERKSAAAEKFIRTCIKNVYIDKLNDIVNKYNTYHGTIKMKPVDVKSNTYIEPSNEINNKDPKFKIGDIVRISKYKNIFAKSYTQNWSEEVFVIKKVKNTVPWTHVINNLNGEILGTFYQKELQKTNQKEFRIEKVIKRKGDTLYAKWKVEFNSWIDKKSNVDKLDIDKLKNVPSNLSNLKSKVDNLDVDKLVPVPVDLSKLSDVVKNDVKKTEYD